MFIYKLFESTKDLDKSDYRNLKIYGMASVKNEQDTPFVACADKRQADVAKQQGRSIVGITAIPFIVPFTSLSAEVRNTHERVNVSGAVWLRINPNAAFREFVLSHEGDALTTSQITVEFAKGLELNLEPYLNHVINTEDVEQLRKHGKDAADISALPDELPSWCDVTKVMLAVDGTATASRYTQQVAEAVKKQDEEDVKKREGFIYQLITKVWPFWKKNVIDVLMHPFDNMVKFKRLCCTSLVVLLLGAWALRLLVFLLGGGSPFERTCQIDFESGWTAEKTASSNLQMFLLETYLMDKFKQSSTSKGKPFGGFKFGETYHFKEEDAQTVRGWVDEYVNARHGTLRHVENDYNHPHGIPKILGWSRPTYQCTVGMEGRLESEPYHLVVENDYEGSVKRRLDEMFLVKGKTKKGVTEYKSLKLRDGDKDILAKTLQNDEALAGKGVVVRHEADHGIVVSVSNYTLNYQLDVTELMMFDDILDVIKSAFQAAVSKDVYFKQGKTETLPLTNGQVDKLQKTLAVEDRVVFTREVVEDGKTERLVFKMSVKERKDRELLELDIQKRAAWWNHDEQALLDTVMDKAKRLDQTIAAIKVAEDATDADYAALLDRIQALRTQLQTAVDELNHLLNQVKKYQIGMEKAILIRAAAHQEQLEKQATAYGVMAKQLDKLTASVGEARWQAKAHLAVNSRHEAFKKAVAEAEQTLKAVQADFRREIPAAVQAGQARQAYKDLEAIAGQWETKCGKSMGDIVDYRENQLKDTFMLENRKVEMDVKTYRARLQDVLNGWQSMKTRASKCKQECLFRQAEMTFKGHQETFWKNVEELNAVERDIKACQTKLQAMRQKLSGMKLEEAKQVTPTIKKEFYEEIVPLQKTIVKRAAALVAYFSSLLPQDDWDATFPYNQMLGRQFLNQPEIKKLTAEYKARIEALLEEQNRKFTELNFGNKKETLTRLKDKAETLKGQGEVLIYIEENDRLYKPLKVWNIQEK